MSDDSDHQQQVMCPRASAEYITSRAQHVNIHQEGIERVAQLLYSEGGQVRSGWTQQPVHPKGDAAFMTDWCFFVDTLNFSFWPDRVQQPAFSVTWQGHTYTGYYSLCACVNRALESGVDLIKPTVYGSLTQQQLTDVLTGDNGQVMPLVTERLQILHDTARVLNQKFKGSFAECLSAAEHSAQRLLALLTTNFASYRDYGQYAGKSVSFLKRAQILCADLHSCLSEVNNQPYFNDIHTLTMFADYRVPQVLHYLGALSYSPALQAMLAAHPVEGYGRLGASNVTQHVECEIRGATIRAGQLIREAMQRAHPPDAAKFDESAIDYFLWCYRRLHAQAVEHNVKFHKTRSIYY